MLRVKRFFNLSIMNEEIEYLILELLRERERERERERNNKNKIVRNVYL